MKTKHLYWLIPLLIVLIFVGSVVSFYNGTIKKQENTKANEILRKNTENPKREQRKKDNSKTTMKRQETKKAQKQIKNYSRPNNGWLSILFKIYS